MLDFPRPGGAGRFVQPLSSHKARIPEMTKILTEGVPFEELASRARGAGHDVNSLVDLFRGKIEDPREFFNRVFQPKHADIIITYRSVLEFYRRLLRIAEKNERACQCGCGVVVFDRQKYATAACKQKSYRLRHRHSNIEFVTA